MRQELFEAIRAKISAEVPEVNHIDLWNHNVEFIEQEDAWERPAVFIEFGPITWDVLKLGIHRGRGLIKVHTVTDWAEGGQASAWSLCRKLSTTLEGLEGESFNGMTLTETATNHNHEDILESIDTYAVRYMLRD